MVGKPTPLDLLVPQRRATKSRPKPLKQDGFTVQVGGFLVLYARRCHAHLKAEFTDEFLQLTCPLLVGRNPATEAALADEGVTLEIKEDVACRGLR